MGQKVVHFEILGEGRRRSTQDFYAKLFGWNVDANNPMNYGMVDGGVGRASAAGWRRRRAARW